MKSHDYDAQYVIQTTVSREDLDLVFLKIDDAPFRIYGVTRDGDSYTRMPTDVAKRIGGSVLERHRNTAGGRVRFVTDSSEVSIRVTLDAPIKKYEMCDLTDFAMAGMDIYSDKTFKGTANPEGIFGDNTYEYVRPCGDKGLPTITMNMPLFLGVKDVYIGVKKGSKVLRAPDYTVERPVVFYGGTATQGAAAYRPGTCYASLLTREFDCNYINLGFAGGARAEKEMSEYISALDMSALVYDIDDPDITAEELRSIHERMFLEFRQKKPDTPVLFLSRPYGKLTDDVKRREQIVKSTYEKAVARGDKNVWLVLGSDFFPDEDVRENFSHDDVYPTDLGCYFMKEAIKPAFAEIVEKIKAQNA